MNDTEDKVKLILQENPFLQLLAQIEGGRTAGQLAEKYPQLVAAVKEAGKAGKLVLEIKIKPEGKGEVSLVEVTASVTAKLPEKDKRPSLFFIDEKAGHLLSRDDPKQTELKFPTGSPQAAAAGR